MADSRQELVEKIAKLFALGDRARGGSEAECMLALERARELMARHGIQMAEVHAKTPSGFAFNPRERDSWTDQWGMSKFDGWLARACANLTQTRAIVHRVGRACTYSFFGDEDDVALAAALMQILTREVRRLARREFTHSVSRRSFSEGFAVRVLERSKQQTVNGLLPTEQQQYGLIVRKKTDLVASAFTEKYPKLKDTGNRGAKYVDPVAYKSGYSEGGRVSLDGRHSLKGRK